MRAELEVKGLATGEKVKRTRLERLQDGHELGEDYIPDMPPCNALYLVSYLFDVGPALAGAMGWVPITETELRNWQWNTGVHLQPWESRMMKRLSKVWIDQTVQSSKEECPAPWIVEQEREQRERTAKKVRALFRSV